MTKAIQASDKDFKQILESAEAASSENELKEAQAELRRLMEDGFAKAETSAAPYSATIEMKDEFRERYFPDARDEDLGVEAGFRRTIGGFALDAANALANAERRVAFRLKTLFGFNGVRLVEEGDSWNSIPYIA